MAELTLHRAGRTLEAIRAAVGRIELDTTAKLSIFGEPVEELGRKSQSLLSEIDRHEKLLAVQSRIRAAVGRTNAELGIADLLAEKAAHEEWIKLVAPVTPNGSAKTAITSYARRRAQEDVTDAASMEARAKAMRERYAASDADVGASIDVRLLDDAATAALSRRVAERRREVERLSDRLRELNARAIHLDDGDLAYLKSEDVI